MNETTLAANAGRIDFSAILNSKYGGLAVIGVILLGGLGIVEISSIFDKGMEKGYNMSAGSEKYGNVNFTVPSATKDESPELPEENSDGAGNDTPAEVDTEETEK